MPDERLLDRLPVDVNVPVGHADVVPGNSDDPLHEVLARLLCLVVAVGILEDQNVVAVNRAVGKHVPKPSGLVGKRNLVHQQVVADEERVLHRAGWNLKRLEHEGGPKNRQDDSHDQRFNGISRRRFFKGRRHDAPCFFPAARAEVPPRVVRRLSYFAPCPAHSGPPLPSPQR